MGTFASSQVRSRGKANTYDLSALDVLVVDDTKFMLKLMKLILKSMEIGNVRCCGNPEDALAEMHERPPDLIITDLLMTPMDGLKLIRKVRQSSNEALRFTPIFTLSGFTDLDHVMSARDAGAHEILTKPISTERLYRRIVSHIESPRKFVKANNFFGPERRLRNDAYGGKELRRAS